MGKTITAKLDNSSAKKISSKQKFLLGGLLLAILFASPITGLINKYVTNTNNNISIDNYLFGCSCGGEDPEGKNGNFLIDDDTVDDDAGIGGGGLGDDDVGDDDTVENCVEPYFGMMIEKDTTLCPGEYYLDSNMEIPAITLSEDGVLLYCDGTKIIGADQSIGRGIVVSEEVSDARIVGCQISNFSMGIEAYNPGKNMNVYEVTISSVGERFVYIWGDGKQVESPSVTNSYFQDSQTTGILFDNCDGGEISNNLYVNNISVHESPIALIDSEGVTVDSNEIRSLGGGACNGIWIFRSNSNTIRNNYVEMGGEFEGDGSHIDDAWGNLFQNNTYVINIPYEQSLVVFGSSLGNTFVGNTFVKGDVVDLGDYAGTSVWCVDGEGNYYLEGAFYSGPDPNGGTCPPDMFFGS